LKQGYEEIKKIKRVRWLVFGIVLAQFASELIMDALASFMAKPFNPYLEIAIVEIFTFIIPFSIYGKNFKNSKNTVEELNMSPMKLSHILLIIPLAISGQFIMQLLDVPGWLILNSLGRTAVTTVLPKTFGNIFLALIAIGIIPAFLEEIWMRGIVFGVFSRVSTYVAVMFTTIIFAILHVNPAEILGIIFLGFMACLLVIRTGSLYSAILFHLVINISSIFATYGMENLENANTIIVLMALSVIVFALLLFLFLKTTKPMIIKKYKREKKMLASSLLSLPVLLSFAIIIIKIWLKSTL